MPEVFHIVPASNRAAATFVPLAGLLFVVLIGAMALLGASIRGSRKSTFELDPAGLRVRGDLYGRLIPASELRGGAARVIDLQQERTLRPTARTMGTAIPGYRAGWFRLADGEKALLYVTDPQRVVYVPTRAGYSVLLSVDRPTEFVERLREIAPAT
jgi:PH (Pleckstrin Homology) domain-containing protein